MAELRKDYILDEYVIIAKERAKRPDQFKNAQKEAPSDPKNCPFCPENENMIPGVLEQDKKKWTVRAIPNKFGAVTMDGNPDIETHNEFYTFADAVGSHEVVIETPKHGKELHQLTIPHIIRVINMYISRIKKNLEVESIKYSVLFKNKGTRAGASIAHSHTQLISYNHIPVKIKNLINKSKEYYESYGSCPYCNIISRETNSDRQISDDGKFFVYSPYASRFNMQFDIIPKRHVGSILELNDEEISSLAENLKKYLAKLDTLSSTPYNILFNNFYDSNGYSHFFISVCPRLATWAGFEHTSGTIINAVPPEEAARFYKE